MPKIKAGTRGVGNRNLHNGVAPLGINDFWNRNPERRKVYTRKGSKEIDVSYIPIGSSGEAGLRKNWKWDL